MHLQNILKIEKNNYQSIISSLIMLLAFSAPLSKGLPNIVAGLIILFWFMEGNLKSKWNEIYSNPVFVSFWAFYGFMIISLLWTNDLSLGLEHIRKWYFVAFLFPILYTTIDRSKSDQVFNAFLGAMLISEIMSYLIFFDVMPFKWKDSWSPTDPSPIMHHTPYSVFLIFSVFLMLIRILDAQKPLIHKIGYSLFIVTMTGNLFINAGRTGQFSFIVILFIFTISYFQFNKLKTLFFTLLISLFVFLPAYYISGNFQTRVNETYNTVHYLILNKTPMEDSTGFRFMMWDTGASIIKHNPIIGTGVGDEREEYSHVLNTEKLAYKNIIEGFSDFHNTYIQITVELGFLGLIFFLNFIYQLVRQMTHNRVHRTIGLTMVACFSIYMLIGNFPVSYLTLFIVIVLSLTLKREKPSHGRKI